MTVQPIPTTEALPWILQKHYAHRVPSISWAYGLFDGAQLLGVATYGTPCSSSLREGVCGADFIDNVIELNRVCCSEGKNQASMIVGGSLRMLPAPKIVVSFADIGHGHVGKIYQATNWIYTGLSAKRTDWKIKGMEGLHGATVADKSRGKENRAKYMRDTFGDDFYLEERSRKHRYVYFVGNKREVKSMRSALRYKVEPYPKGESKRYDASASIQTQQTLF